MTGQDKIWRVYVETNIEYEFTNTTCEFFFDKVKAEAFIEKTNKRNQREDGSWIPNITSMEFELEEVTIDDVTDEMSVDQFISLFGISLNGLLAFAEDKE